MTKAGENQPRLAPKRGDEDFAVFRDEGIYYADKTQFLKPLFSGTGSRLLLLRPRRFGKTLTMSTLRRFLEIDFQNPGDTSRQQELFRGLKVMEDTEFCGEHMGRHPVVSLSLKDADGIGFADAYDSLAGTISDLAHDFLWLDGPLLTKDEHDFLSMLTGYRHLREPDNSDYVEQSLVFLCRLLRKCFGDSHKPVLLIDEYDVPLQKAAAGGYYEPMNRLVGTMLNRALMDRDDICKVILTGCLPATGEAIFTGVNGLCIDTVLARGNGLSAAIGFTPAEARAMLGYYGFGDLYEKAAGWYGGYSIGGEALFCPWDITSHVRELCRSRDPAAVRPKSHWNLTSSSNFIAGFMPRLAPEDAERMQDLIAGRSISLPADEGMSYGTLDFNNLRSAEFWNILIYTGYLTLSRTGSGGANELRIPNKEILGYFRNNISGYYRNTWSKEYGTLVRSLMERLLSADSGGAEDSMSALLGGFVPPEENAPKAPHGDFYRIFLDSLFAAAVQNIRDCKSLFGSGFAEITFRSAGCTYAAVIRIEYAPDSTAGLHTLTARALEHLGEKGCAKALLSKQKIKGVAECGMAFRGRSCAVSCRELLPETPDA